MALTNFRTLAVIVVALNSGCVDPPPDGIAVDALPEFMAVGTFNSADPSKGTVNISHAAVPAANWPAMTMDFKLADPGEATDLKPGDRVDLHFTIEGGMNATITHLAPIE